MIGPTVNDGFMADHSLIVPQYEAGRAYTAALRGAGDQLPTSGYATHNVVGLVTQGACSCSVCASAWELCFAGGDVKLARSLLADATAAEPASAMKPGDKLPLQRLGMLVGRAVADKAHSAAAAANTAGLPLTKRGNTVASDALAGMPDAPTKRH